MVEYWVRSLRSRYCNHRGTVIIVRGRPGSMLWRGGRESSNIEDRRGMSGGKVAIGGGLGTVVILLLALLFGADPRRLLQQLPQEDINSGTQTSRPINPE